MLIGSLRWKKKSVIKEGKKGKGKNDDGIMT